MGQKFRNTISALWVRHRPSRHPFFLALAECPPPVAKSPAFLDELYVRYQAAMHATRVMVYFLPHLDAIDLRMKKLRIIADDDGAANGDSHHYQLRRTWTTLLNRPPTMRDEDFGDLTLLKERLDAETTEFVSLVQHLYPKSLGPWIMVEGMAHDWIGGLVKSLAVHFPGVERTDYFLENYSNCLEVRHAAEALETSETVLARFPHLHEETALGARLMAEGLDRLWSSLERLVRTHQPRT